ncbi:hypothetical protein [Methanofollis fontis]|uniref:Uncharacterized protein n=1 Tax=Methanofollis fontis TaxID=2052832 RepID=A0A483CNI0_9EURY|nr:hypothetical protein [Methanofollis fontis]TAJ44550.1 hypothetical protein CUJ86_04340 [Methanofollis fontis]
MDFERKAAIAVALLILAVAAAMIAQGIAEREVMAITGEEVASPIPHSEITLTAVAFLYGPQDYRPYAKPLSLNTIPETDNGTLWYLAFVMLNDTPQGGNPALFRQRSVAVDYAFQNLSGTAAFYLYGTRAGFGKSWTSRQEGYGACGWTVRGDAPAGEVMPQVSVLQNTFPVRVRLANTMGLGPDEITTGVMTFWFPLVGSGEDAIHITSDLAHWKGEIVTDAPPSGRFFITHTGGSEVGSVCLCVAVDQPQPDSFSLWIHTEPAEAAGWR